MKCYHVTVTASSIGLGDVRLYENSIAFPFYRPRSKASEGYVFTGVCHSVTAWRGGGGRWATPMVNPPWDQVRTSTPWDQVGTSTPPPPGTRSEHLPPPDQVRTSTPPSREHRQVGCMHPTGMHACYILVLDLTKLGECRLIHLITQA